MTEEKKAWEIAELTVEEKQKISDSFRLMFNYTTYRVEFRGTFFGFPRWYQIAVSMPFENTVHRYERDVYEWATKDEGCQGLEKAISDFSNKELWHKRRRLKLHAEKQHGWQEVTCKK